MNAMLLFEKNNGLKRDGLASMEDQGRHHRTCSDAHALSYSSFIP